MFFLSVGRIDISSYKPKPRWCCPKKGRAGIACAKLTVVSCEETRTALTHIATMVVSLEDTSFVQPFLFRFPMPQNDQFSRRCSLQLRNEFVVMAEAREATLEREEQELKMEALLEEKEDIKQEIALYRGQQTVNDDRRNELKLALKIARLELEINGYKIDLENAATDKERRRKEKQIETKELLLHDLNQLRGLPPQPMQVAQQGKLLFLSFRFFIFSIILPFSTVDRL
jgi:hypothetical protein